MRLRVPGNVLLAGEYLVLEPGGLGLCLAAAEYVEAEAEIATELRIEGTRGDETVLWTASDPACGAASPLFSELVRSCAEELGGIAAVAPLSIRVDSSAHYYPDGRKKGLGSSAAVSVAVAALLLRDLADDPAYLPSIFQTALRAHRRLQGGKGSGYDVASSTFGGLGLFTGGSEPRYDRLAHRELPSMTLLPGPREVSTAEAVGAYERWKLREGATAARYLEASNGIVKVMAESPSATEFAAGLDLAARLGRRVGEAVGVSAELEADLPGALPESGPGVRRPPAPSLGFKALGAGNELVLAYERAGADGSRYPLPGSPLSIATGGVEWLER